MDIKQESIPKPGVPFVIRAFCLHLSQAGNRLLVVPVKIWTGEERVVVERLFNPVPNTEYWVRRKFNIDQQKEIKEDLEKVVKQLKAVAL